MINTLANINASVNIRADLLEKKTQFGGLRCEHTTYMDYWYSERLKRVKIQKEGKE